MLHLVPYKVWMTSYVFVTGGVISSLGKGVVAAAIGRMLKSRRLKVSVLKLDPYLNVDPGTMSPFQHGEVFVTADGLETDLDLGHYERFIDRTLTSLSSVTAGQIYRSLIEQERSGVFLGGTIQAVPHLTGEIKRRVRDIATKEEAQVVLVEVGGTVGDIEGEPFIESVRQMRAEGENVLSVHLTLLPHLSNGELKTKPTQHSVRTMRSMGVQPDLILCRSDYDLTDDVCNKISLYCDVEPEAVVRIPTLESIYEAPVLLEESGIGELVMKKLGLKGGQPDLASWRKFKNFSDPDIEEVEIAVVGKYVELQDSYISVKEALKHAAWNNHRRLKLHWIQSEELIGLGAAERRRVLGDGRGILVPGGFGERGVAGMIEVAKYARENDVPYFGICLGLQVMIIEFARNVLKLADADSEEFNLEAAHKVIHLMPAQNGVSGKGATMRLGNWLCDLAEGTIAHRAYKKSQINERHRHRYEINNEYKERLARAGLVCSGMSPDLGLVEIAELANHAFMLGCQFHPEFGSRPDRVHPLFNEFVKAAIERTDRQIDLPDLQESPAQLSDS